MDPPGGRLMGCQTAPLAKPVRHGSTAAPSAKPDLRQRNPYATLTDIGNGVERVDVDPAAQPAGIPALVRAVSDAVWPSHLFAVLTHQYFPDYGK